MNGEMIGFILYVFFLLCFNFLEKKDFIFYIIVINLILRICIKKSIKGDNIIKFILFLKIFIKRGIRFILSR